MELAKLNNQKGDQSEEEEIKSASSFFSDENDKNNKSSLKPPRMGASNRYKKSTTLNEKNQKNEKGNKIKLTESLQNKKRELSQRNEKDNTSFDQGINKNSFKGGTSYAR